MRVKRYELVAVQTRGVTVTSVHHTREDALREAEKYRRLPAGQPQIWDVWLRDVRRYPNYDLAVANQEVLLTAGRP